MGVGGWGWSGDGGMGGDVLKVLYLCCHNRGKVATAAVHSGPEQQHFGCGG